MHVHEEVVIGLLAFMVAFVCWMLPAADERTNSSRGLPRLPDSPERQKDIEDRL